MAQSRHPDRVGECPLSGVKQTSQIEAAMSLKAEIAGVAKDRKPIAKWSEEA
jgi:hypothetical protein